ncbi:MAG: hypothetical protein AAF485_25160 [Chloroflexota bacterium]
MLLTLTRLGEIDSEYSIKGVIFEVEMRFLGVYGELIPDRWTPEMLAAIDEVYVVARRVGEIVIYKHRYLRF